MPENKLKNSTIKNIAVTRGLAFALVTAVYIYMDNTLSGYLWCVYVGFFLSMALGAKNGKMFNYILSALIGYGWAFLYVNLGGWLSAVFPVPVNVLHCYCRVCPYISFVYSSKISVKYKA